MLSFLIQGGPRGEGGYFAGQVCALVLGGLFFIAGIVYGILGIVSLQGDTKKKRRARVDDEDRPRRKPRSRVDDDDDDDRPRKRRRPHEDDED